MRLDEKITSVAFGRPKIESDKNVPRIRVCVLGLPAVGKTGKTNICLRSGLGFMPLKCPASSISTTQSFYFIANQIVIITWESHSCCSTCHQ